MCLFLKNTRQTPQARASPNLVVCRTHSAGQFKHKEMSHPIGILSCEATSFVRLRHRASSRSNFQCSSDFMSQASLGKYSKVLSLLRLSELRLKMVASAWFVLRSAQIWCWARLFKEPGVSIMLIRRFGSNLLCSSRGCELDYSGDARPCFS